MNVVVDERTATTRTLLPELAGVPGHLLWRANARVVETAEECLGEVDLHTYSTLLVLGTDRALSQQAIADRIVASRTTVAKIAAALVDGGLVQRQRNPADRRAYLLTITTAGRETASGWIEATTALEDRLSATLTGAGSRRLRHLLHLLIEHDLDPDTPAELRGSLAFLITRSHLRMHRDFADVLTPTGLEPRHVGFLLALTSLGPVSQSELGRAIGVSGASTVQIVDDLEAVGLLERIRPAHDRRTQVIHLLPDAAPALDRALALAEAIPGDRMGSLEPGQIDDLIGLLQAFVTAA